MRKTLVFVLMFCGIAAYARGTASEPAKLPRIPEKSTNGGEDKRPQANELEKEHKKIVKTLEKIEKGDFQKLQRLRLEKERDGRDIGDFLKLFNEAEGIMAELRKASQDPDPESLIAAWRENREHLQRLLDDSSQALKKAAMRQGVTKKDIQLKKRAADERSGCSKFMPLDDRYGVCQKRGLPMERHSQVMQSFIPDTLDSSEVPIECTGPRGPEWHHAPEVEVWKYKDTLNSGFVYYAFVDGFSALLGLMGKQELSHQDIVQAFIQSCREIAAPGGMKLAYVGTFPMDERNFLGVLFQNQSDHRPADAFGSDGLSRVSRAMAPASPFTLEALLFDTTFRQIAAKTRETISMGEALLQKFPPEAKERFEKKLAEGVRAGKTNYAAAAEAFADAAKLLKEGDPLLSEVREHERSLKTLAEEFDGLIDARIKALLSQKPKNDELVFRVGEQVYLFFLLTGSPLPHLRLTLRIAIPGHTSETGDVAEELLGVISRSYLDTYDGGTAERVFSFSIDDYQKHHLAFFAMPFMIAPLGATLTTGEVLTHAGVWNNTFLVADAPGTYLMYFELIDEETNSKETRKFTFSVVP